MRLLLGVAPEDELAIAQSARRAADLIVLELAGARDEVAARRRAAEVLERRRAQTAGPRLYVGVHVLEDPRVEADLDALVACAPDGVVLPRAASGPEIQRLSAKIAVREAECGAPDGSIKILARAGGSGAALLKLATFAGASRRLVGLIWSAPDLAAALGCAPDAEPLRVGRSLVLFAGAAAGAPVYACLEAGADDEAALAAECRRAGLDGFAGVLAADPRQLVIAAKESSPSQSKIAYD